MKPESANRIIDAYFEVFDQLSVKSFTQGWGVIIDELEDRLRSIRPIRTREGFLAKLLKEREPEPFELEAQIEMIHLLPYKIRKVMPEAVRKAGQAFPQDPGGRPRAFTDEESRYVCKEIGELIVRGVRLGDAQTQLALRMSKKLEKDISVRSVQRAWQDRAKWFGAKTEDSTT
jgi:hypothetical protein